MTLLEINDLSVSFTQYDKGLRRREVPVIRKLSMSVNEGEIVAVVGASGSGKSVLAHAIVGLLPNNAKVTGNMLLNGEKLTPSSLKKLRGRTISLVPQSVDYLDPLMRVGKQVMQAVRFGDPADEQRKVFQQYRLPPNTANRYPFQLSGGMARRVLVSMGKVSGAKLLIADEPTPGLDEAVIQETLLSFQQFAASGSGIVFITHDLEAALQIAGRVAVFHSGMLVEVARAADFAGKGDSLRHPYSRALWLALPQNEFAAPPAAASGAAHHNANNGCVFAQHCTMAAAECETAIPELRTLRNGTVRCCYAT